MEDIQPNCVALFCVRHRKLLLLLIVLLIPASFTATILLSNVAFSLNTDLDSFIQSDEIASLQFDAVEAAKVMEAENIANLIERLTSTEPSDEGNRRMLQSTSVQRNSATEVVLFYNATLTGDIFSEEVLRDIRKIEMGIRNLPGFDDVCYIVGDTPSCAGFKSITNFFFPYRSNNVLVFDGSGTELLPRDQGIEQLLKTSGSIWMVDKKFASNGRNSQVARAIISTGLPLEGFESKDDRAEEQQKRIDDFLINTLYPYLVAASTENVRVLWYSGSLSIHEIVSSALHDALVGSGAIAFVFVAVWFHCKSIVISAFALISIIYAFPVTYCVVAIGLEKPDLSLFVVLSVFIVVGIGADDTFLFASIWKQSRILVRRARLDFSNHHSQDGNKKPKSLREDQLKSLAFRLTWTFSHASMATLVTSCTTSASFFANLASPVVPIRDFGLFMGVLVLCNYVCIVLIIPLTLVIQEEDVVPFAKRIMECLRIPTNTKPWSDSISTASVEESRNSTSNEKVPGSPQSPSSTPGLPHIPVVGEHFTIAGHPRDSRNIGYSAARYTSDHPTNKGSAQPSGRTNLGSTQPIDPTNIRSEQPSHPTNNGSSSNPGHPRVINLERAPDNFHDSDSEIELEDIPIMIDCEEGDGGYRESLQSLTSFQIEPDTRNVNHALDDISLDHESTDPIVEQHTLQERELAIARAINRIVDRASNTDEQPALDREATNLKRLLEQSENPTPKKPPLPRKPHAKRSVSERLKDKLLTRGESEAFRQVAQQGQRLVDRDEISHVISKAQGFEQIEVMMHNNVSVCIQKSSYLLIFSFLLLSVLMGYFAITQIRVSDDLPKFFAEEQNLGSIEQLQRTHFGETSGSSRVIPVVVPSCTIDPATNQCVTFTCPGREQECSGQGTCASSGACTCNSKYRGEDCSVAWTAADLKPSEALAWRAVFDEFGGSSWLECSDKRLDPCSCSRVSCIAESPGSSTHTLERVDLSGNQLSGVLSSSDLSTFAGSLAIFQNLEVVNIANNPNLIIEAGACWTSGSCGQISCTVPNEWAICSGVSPTPLPTPLPTKQPTLNPTPRPTSAPVTPAPTTESPTRSPTTKSPTRSPETKPPTGSPTRKPTANPTTSPTKPLATPAPTNTNSPTSPPSTGSPTTESPTAPPTPIPTLSPTQSPDTAAPTASLRSDANLAGGSIAPGEWIGGTPSPLPFTGATLDLGGGQTVFSVTLPFSLATASVSLTATDSAATIEITVTVPSGGLSLTDTSKGSYSQVVPFSLVSEGAVAQVAIRVVAEDGVTSKDYQVNIRRDLAICDPGCENGSCVRGECECDEGFTGSTCEVQACPGNCFGNGECVIENDIGTCDCFDGYLSNNCSIADKSLEGLPDSRTEIIGVNFGVGLFDRESGKVSYNSSFNPTLPEVQQSIVNLCAGLTDGSISADTKEYLGLRRLKRCPMASFRDYVQVYTESDFPIRAGEEVFYEHFYNFMIINPGFRTLLGLDSEGKLRRISFEIQTNIDKQSGAVAASTEYEKWEVFLQSYVAERAPNLPAPQQVSQLWARSATEIAAVNGTILAFVISASCAFAAILLFTGNLVIALWNTLTIVAIVSTLIGIMVVGMGLTLGVVEAVALSVFCGLNVDYACHLSQSYNSSNSKTRFGKMRHSLTSVGGSLLGAAFTTVVSSVFLVFCKIQVFVTFGIVLAINMFLAIVLSVFVFGSLMVRFGPVGTCGSICIIPEKPCCCNTGGSNTVDQSIDSTSSTSDRQLQHHEHDAAVEAVVIH